jgi:hypothetical protein
LIRDVELRVRAVLPGWKAVGFGDYCMWRKKSLAPSPHAACRAYLLHYIYMSNPRAEYPLPNRAYHTKKKVFLFPRKLWVRRGKDVSGRSGWCAGLVRSFGFECGLGRVFGIGREMVQGIGGGFDLWGREDGRSERWVWVWV